MSQPKKPRQSKLKYPVALPKGSFPLPTGGHATPTSSVVMTQRGPRRITVTGVRRENPDTRMLAKVLLDMAKRLAQQERPD